MSFLLGRSQYIIIRKKYLDYQTGLHDVTAVILDFTLIKKGAIIDIYIWAITQPLLQESSLRSLHQNPSLRQKIYKMKHYPFERKVDS